MSYSDSFPTQRPSLNLVFNGGSDQLDSRISYSRSSTGTYLSNEKALSSENLLLDSKTGTGNWTGNKSGAALVPVITANHAASPDGTANQATRVQLDLNGSTTGSDYARYYQAHNVANGTSATFCIWAKSTDGASSYAAQLLAPDGSGTAITITGSWQKFSATATSVGNVTYGIRLRGGQTPTNADTADILIWGANLSTTGQTVLSETTTQIHREYSPLLKTAAANAPRFEFASDSQSDAGSPRGLLIEAQATNLRTYSEDFSNSAWAKPNVTATAEAISPDGTLNAFAIREHAVGGTKRVHQAATVASGSVAVSVYAKILGNERRLVIREDSATGDSAVFDLSSGTVAATNVGGAGKIESVGNGWYRCTLLTSPGSGSKSFGFWLATAAATNYESYTGDGYSGVLLFGAQLENASASSSYIKTTSSSVSRASDSCSVATSSFGFTGGPVSIVAETEAGAGLGPAPRLFNLNDGSSTTRLMLYKDSTAADNTVAWYAFYGAAGMGTLAGSNNSSKVGVSVDTNDFAANSDTGVLLTNSTGTQYTFSELYVGSNYNGTANHINGHIKRVALYNVALSDTELQALTS